jgi:hypothetical protein
LRLVGERGPEIEATGPSRIHTAEQINAPVVEAINELLAEVRALVSVNQAGALETIDRLDTLIESTDAQTRQVKKSNDAAIVAGRA